MPYRAYNSKYERCGLVRLWFALYDNAIYTGYPDFEKPY